MSHKLVWLTTGCTIAHCKLDDEDEKNKPPHTAQILQPLLNPCQESTAHTLGTSDRLD